MATRTQVETQVGQTPYLVLHFAEHSTQPESAKPHNTHESKTDNKLGGRTPVVTVPKPISSAQEGHVRSRLELQMIAGREQKIRSLLQQVQTMPETRDWIEEFNEYTLDQTEERSISLMCFVIEVLTPLNLDDLKVLACEIIQVMLPDGARLDEFLVSCPMGLSKRREFLEKCRREHIVALAHFEACRSFEKKNDAQLQKECQALQERMRSLQAYRHQITQESRVQINALVQRVNSLEEQLRNQRTAIQGQDLGEASLNSLVTEFRTFLEGLKQLR